MVRLPRSNSRNAAVSENISLSVIRAAQDALSQGAVSA